MSRQTQLLLGLHVHSAFLHSQNTSIMAIYKYSDFTTGATFDGDIGNKPLFTTADSFVIDNETITAASLQITGTTTAEITIGSQIFYADKF